MHSFRKNETASCIRYSSFLTLDSSVKHSSRCVVGAHTFPLTDLSRRRALYSKQRSISCIATCSMVQENHHQAKHILGGAGGPRLIRDLHSRSSAALIYSKGDIHQANLFLYIDLSSFFSIMHGFAPLLLHRC